MNLQHNAHAVITTTLPSTVALTRFYPGARDIKIPTKPNLFLPDEWGEIFAQGIVKLRGKPGFTGGHTLEVGSGTAINDVGMLTIPGGPRKVTATDICNDAVTAAGTLAREYGLKIVAIQSDLLKNVSDETLEDVDHIVACIPQVPTPTGIALSKGDNYAHYYNPTGLPEQWNHFGLGLNAGLIQEATQRAPQAAITLNLSGRPGLPRLLQLFEAYGRPAEVLHERMVPQHHETSVESLAILEQQEFEHFEFYKDEKGTQQIGATEAEQRRLANEPLFHKVYVLHTPGLD